VRVWTSNFEAIHQLSNVKTRNFQLAAIERISSELKKTREQYSSADKVVEKMKTTELELSEDLQVCTKFVELIQCRC